MREWENLENILRILLQQSSVSGVHTWITVYDVTDKQGKQLAAYDVKYMILYQDQLHRQLKTLAVIYNTVSKPAFTILIYAGYRPNGQPRSVLFDSASIAELVRALENYLCELQLESCRIE